MLTRKQYLAVSNIKWQISSRYDEYLNMHIGNIKALLNGDVIASTDYDLNNVDIEKLKDKLIINALEKGKI